MSQTERRDRLVHGMLGAGVLVWEDDEYWMRFEFDSGPVMRFQWAKLGTGRPKLLKKRWHDEMTDEERNWMTIETKAGEVFVFRKESAPPLVAAAEPSAQLGML